ncbi:hypothetical protein HOM50_02135 [bacterium]|jgi:hypothetical protein|nr:hypothetical protein [bacterium]MBT5015182.1 hypothetical protein [bacterium]
MKKYMLIVLVGLMGASQLKAGDWLRSYLGNDKQERIEELQKQVDELQAGLGAALQQVGGGKEMREFNDIIQNLGTAMLDKQARMLFIARMSKPVAGVPVRRVLEVYREMVPQIEAGVERVLRQRGVIK